jgi:hypothetical protein
MFSENRVGSIPPSKRNSVAVERRPDSLSRINAMCRDVINVHDTAVAPNLPLTTFDTQR